LEVEHAWPVAKTQPKGCIYGVVVSETEMQIPAEDIVRVGSATALVLDLAGSSRGCHGR
jgi:hypothetical protein